MERRKMTGEQFMGIKIFAIILSSLVLMIAIDLVRREKLTFKYAFGWMLMSALAIFFVIFDNLLFEFSRWFGFTLPSNFIFFTLLFGFVIWSLFLTVFLCQQDTRNDTMAQKIGILEMEIEYLKKKSESSH